MLLKEVFLDISDLERALRAQGDQEAIPYFRTIYDGEEEYLKMASEPNIWVGFYMKDGEMQVVGPDSIETVLSSLVKKGRSFYMRLNNGEYWMKQLQGGN